MRALTGGWDRSVAHLGATPDGRTLLVSADELGQRALFALDVKTGVARRLVADGEVEDFAVTPRQRHLRARGSGRPGRSLQRPARAAARRSA